MEPLSTVDSLTVNPTKLLHTTSKIQTSLERKASDQAFVKTTKSLSKARWYLLSKVTTISINAAEGILNWGRELYKG